VADAVQPRGIVSPVIQHTNVRQTVVISRSPNATADAGYELDQEPAGDLCFVLDCPRVFFSSKLAHDQAVSTNHVAGADGQLRFLDPEDPQHEPFDQAPDPDDNYPGLGIRVPCALMSHAGAILYDDIDAIYCFKVYGATPFFVSVLTYAGCCAPTGDIYPAEPKEYIPDGTKLRILVPLRADQEQRFVSMMETEMVPCEIKRLRPERTGDPHALSIAELLAGTPYGLEMEAVAAKVIRLPEPVLEED
jgi:hypothetical protein